MQYSEAKLFTWLVKALVLLEKANVDSLRRSERFASLRSACLIAVGACCLTGGAIAANVVVNGDFQTGDLSGWMDTPGLYYWRWGVVGPDPSGDFEVTGAGQGVLFQELPLSTGRQYKLTLSFSGSDFGYNAPPIQVRIGDYETGFVAFRKGVFDTTFTAHGDNVLSFVNLSEAQSVFLDDISVMAYGPSPVPSPAPPSRLSSQLTLWDKDGPRLGPLKPGQPTFVLTHGWQPDERMRTGSECGEAAGILCPSPWVVDARDALFERFEREGREAPNVLTWAWKDAYTTKGLSGFLEATAAAKSDVGGLARAIVGRFGSEIEQLHLIGHSLGTVLNAETARFLTSYDDRLVIPQITHLDVPQYFGRVPLDPFIGQLEDYFEYTYASERIGFVDNYHGIRNRYIPYVDPEFPSTGMSIDGAYNKNFRDYYHAQFPVEYVCSVRGLCPDGFNWSVALGGPPSGITPRVWSPTRLVTLTLLSFGPFEIFNATVYPTHIEIFEQSPGYVWNSTFSIPSDVDFLDFEYSCVSAGDGDHLSLNFDSELLFNVPCDAEFVGEWLGSGLIDLSPFRGSVGQLLFTLNSVGEPNARFGIRELQFISIASVPQPGPLGLLAAAGAAVGLARHRKRSHAN